MLCCYVAVNVHAVFPRTGCWGSLEKIHRFSSHFLHNEIYVLGFDLCLTGLVSAEITDRVLFPAAWDPLTSDADSCLPGRNRAEESEGHLPLRAFVVEAVVNSHRVLCALLWATAIPLMIKYLPVYTEKLTYGTYGTRMFLENVDKCTIGFIIGIEF